MEKVESTKGTETLEKTKVEMNEKEEKDKQHEEYYKRVKELKEYTEQKEKKEKELQEKEEKEYKEKEDEFNKLTPSQQIQKLDELLLQSKEGKKKKPTYDQDNRSKYEVYLDLAAHKLNTLSEIDELPPEEEEYFKTLVIFVNSFMGGINFTYLPLVQLRVSQLFPDLESQLTISAFSSAVFKRAKEKYGKKFLGKYTNLSKDEKEKYMKNQWKPSQNPPKTLKFSTD